MYFSNCRVETKNGNVNVTLENLQEEGTLDAVAYALNLWTRDELWENNIDYVYDEQINALENWPGFEIAFRDALDAREPKAMSTLPEYLKESEDSELTFGDFVRLKRSRLFAEALKTWKSVLVEQWRENYETDLPQMNAYVEKVRDGFETDLFREWLNGDRNSQGVLGEIKHFFDLEAIDYIKDTDTLTLTFSPESAAEMIQEYMETDQDWQGTEQENAFLLQALKSSLESKTDARHEKERAEREKRKAERESLAAYKLKQAELEHAAELKAAKERKAKLDTEKK